MENERGVYSVKIRPLRVYTYAHTFMFQNCLVNTPKYSKLCMYRYSELTFSYSFFSVWTHKLKFLAKLLPTPKRAKNYSFCMEFVANCKWKVVSDPQFLVLKSQDTFCVCIYCRLQWDWFLYTDTYIQADTYT